MTDQELDLTTLNASEARHAVAAAADIEQLGRWHAKERAHPRFAGGRDSVMKAIDERITELTPIGEGGAAADPEPPELAADRPWTEGSWAGLTQYGCRHCRFETLERADIEHHVTQAHGFLVGPAPASAPSAAVEVQPSAPWSEAFWAGLPQFNCAFCRFQTLERGEIEHHLAAAHPLEWRRHTKQRR